jgi:hypothetical protein
VIAEIARILNISADRIIVREEDNGLDAQIGSDNSVATNVGSSSGISPPSLGRRLLNSNVVFIMLPDPSDKSTTTPINLIDELQDKRQFLKDSYPTLSNAEKIEGYVLLGKTPVFMRTPVIGSTIGRVLTLLDLSLTDLGWVYVCVVASEETPTTPTSW